MGAGQGQAEGSQTSWEGKISICNHLIQCFHVRKVVFAVETQAPLHSALRMLHAESWVLPTSRFFLHDGHRCTAVLELGNTAQGRRGSRWHLRAEQGDPEHSEKGDTANFLK